MSHFQIMSIALCMVTKDFPTQAAVLFSQLESMETIQKLHTHDALLNSTDSEQEGIVYNSVQ